MSAARQLVLPAVEVGPTVASVPCSGCGAAVHLARCSRRSCPAIAEVCSLCSTSKRCSWCARYARHGGDQ